jgi:hypothetical protein
MHLICQTSQLSNTDLWSVSVALPHELVVDWELWTDCMSGTQEKIKIQNQNYGPENIAQWKSACLTWTRPWL